MARKKPTTTDLTAQSVGLADFAAKALVAAEQIGIKMKPVEGFPLEPTERLIAAEIPSLSASIKKKLLKKAKKKASTFTIAETANIVMAIADSLLEGDARQRLISLLFAKKLIDCLQKGIVKPGLIAIARDSGTANAFYQFKITLQECHLSIWRRIQVQDRTLDKLHEHIQTAMGWTNSHLHHFIVGKQLYGDPDLLQDNFKEMEYKDSTTTTISDILPTKGKKFRFQYEYDFGDSWNHEVLFEGFVQADPKAKYPLCLEGERACPPEDCGGVWGYGDFVEAIQDKKHERHRELLEWIGGRFDSEDFDPVAATKAMKKGLPDWRKMEGW